MKRIYVLGVIIISGAFLSGCLSVPKPGSVERIGPEQAEISLAQAMALQDKAVDRAGVLKSIAAFEAVLADDPENIEAWARLANMHILLGAAYESTVSAKREAYRKAMQLSVQAMLTDPAFAAEIKNGSMVWEAAAGLGEAYVAPVSFWSTALFYQYDECLNKLFKPFNLRWIRRAEQMLAYAYRLDPDWGGGQLHFSYGIYYLMPKIAGGNLEKSKDYFAKAVAVGDGWLLNRWGRARYLYELTGDADGQREDLEWVVAQDPYAVQGPACWNVFIQRDARKLLAEKGFTD